MKTSADELIEKTLQGMRTAEPSPALESRILAALEQRAAQPRASFWTHRSAQLATAACGAWCLFAILHKPHETPHRPVSDLVAASSHSTSPLSSAQHQVAVQSTRLYSLSSKLAVPAVPPWLAARETAEDLAREETFAPSLVSPVEPLTHGESLLKYLAQKDDLVQVAESIPPPIPISRPPATTWPAIFAGFAPQAVAHDAGKPNDNDTTPMETIQETDSDDQ